MKTKIIKRDGDNDHPRQVNLADPYDILGVSRDATDDEIKKAFKKLAAELHPDKPGGDETLFIAAKKARECLLDEKARRRFDQYGAFGDGVQDGAGLRNKAISEIRSLLKHIVLKVPDIKSRNAIKEMTSMLCEAHKGIGKEIKGIDAILEKINDAYGRFKPKNEKASETCRAILGELKGEILAQEKKREERLEKQLVLDEAIEILNFIRYEAAPITRDEACDNFQSKFGNVFIRFE